MVTDVGSDCKGVSDIPVTAGEEAAQDTTRKTSALTGFKVLGGFENKPLQKVFVDTRITYTALFFIFKWDISSDLSVHFTLSLTFIWRLSKRRAVTHGPR